MTEDVHTIRPSENEACTSQVTRLFNVFSRYTDPGKYFCGNCYTPEEIRRITETPLRQLDVDSGRKLLWESYDHGWDSANVYRHYLPRLLQLLGPPWFVEDLYPRHLFQTLLKFEFRKWPTDEQVAVIEFLECVSSYLKLASEDDRLEWEAGLAALKDPLRFATDRDFQTTTLTELTDAKLPAGADVRFLIVGDTGTMIHCTVPGLQVSKATYHSTVTEFWYVLEGRGEIWRDNGIETEVTVLAPDTSIDIPPGTAYQYRNVTVIDLKFICIIIPPLPGDISEDTYIVKGKWQPTI